MMYMNLSNIAILNIHSVDYDCKEIVTLRGIEIGKRKFHCM